MSAPHLFLLGGNSAIAHVGEAVAIGELSFEAENASQHVCLRFLCFCVYLQAPPASLVAHGDVHAVTPGVVGRHQPPHRRLIYYSRTVWVGGGEDILKSLNSYIHRAPGRTLDVG